MFEGYNFTYPNVHTKGITDIKWNNNGTLLCTASNDKSIKVSQFDGKDAKVLHTIPCNTATTMVCWHPNDPKRFAIGGDDRFVDIWDVRGMYHIALLLH